MGSRLGLALGARGTPASTWASLGHVQEGPTLHWAPDLLQLYQEDGKQFLKPFG